jgi:glycosyltransferase involved in cell wall biosynthesis
MLRVSVVTPNYNMASYLEATMQSVFANLQPGDEYFVIDGGSRDGSAGLIEKHAGRLTGWISEPDRGYADALAKGFARATGDILCWINSGDLLLDGSLARARLEVARTGADMIFGDDFYIDEDNRVIRYSCGRVKNLRYAMLYGGWTPLQDACFWTRALYQRAGGLDPDLKAAADYDLFLRMVTTGTAQYVPVTFSAFRRHGGQKSIAQQAAYAREREMVRQRELGRVISNPLATAAREAWNINASRIWSRTAPYIFARPDLVGRAIATLPCADYRPQSV